MIYKKVLIFTFLVLILILLYFCLRKKRDKCNDDFIDLSSFYTDIKYVKDVFNYIFSDVKYKYKNAFIYSFTKIPVTKDKNNLYVQYSGESYYADPNEFTINFIPALNVPNNVIFLYGLFSLYERNININKLLEKRPLKNNKKFCLFCVSNGACEPRNNFFTELCKYKKVDSCGKHLNNMDGFVSPGDHGSKEYLDFISSYKFMICFENGTSDYYFTEKLLNAYINNTIPIYWGCPQVPEFLNMEAIFYLKPNYTNEDVYNLISEIIKVDNDDNLYKEKFEQPLFINNKLPDLFSLEKIKENVNKILI